MRKIIIITLSLAVIGLAGSRGFAQEAKPHPPQAPKPEKSARPERAPASTPTPGPSGPPAQIEPVTVKLPRGGKISFSSRSGAIILTGWDRDVVQATAASENGPEPIETQTTGDAAHPRLLLISPAPSSRRVGREVKIDVKVPRYADVETPEGYRGNIEISGVEGVTLINVGNGDVRVARAGPLKVSRRNGDVTVKDLKGDFTARTYHGDIVADTVAGAVDVAATNGDLSVRNAGGDVRANSLTGDVGVHCAKGRADLQSASGSITIVGIDGDVEASTASGEVGFTGMIRAGNSYRLKSLTGAVMMTIQPDAGFTATLSTYSGGLETDFPLKVESPVQRGPLNRRLTGTFGDGKAKIALDSFGGAVKIAKGTTAALKECK